MHLTDLRILDFRNLGSVHLQPNARFNILEGMNGQGKTNILEAIYVLGALKSFRPAQNAELVRFGASVAELRAVAHRNSGETVLRMTLAEGARRLWVDSKPARSIA